jgi:hypothetical protein
MPLSQSATAQKKNGTVVIFYSCGLKHQKMFHAVVYSAKRLSKLAFFSAVGYNAKDFLML